MTTTSSPLSPWHGVFAKSLAKHEEIRLAMKECYVTREQARRAFASGDFCALVQAAHRDYIDATLLKQLSILEERASMARDQRTLIDVRHYQRKAHDLKNAPIVRWLPELRPLKWQVPFSFTY